jgi:hypothetical protein
MDVLALNASRLDIPDHGKFGIRDIALLVNKTFMLIKWGSTEDW